MNGMEHSNLAQEAKTSTARALATGARGPTLKGLSGEQKSISDITARWGEHKNYDAPGLVCMALRFAPVAIGPHLGAGGDAGGRLSWATRFLRLFRIKRLGLLRMPQRRPDLPVPDQETDLVERTLTDMLNTLISLLSHPAGADQPSPARLAGLPSVALTPRFLQSPTFAA